MNQQQIKQLVRTRVTPTPQHRQKIKETVTSLLIKIDEELLKLNSPAQPTLVGSIAKDTYLPESLDIDIFLVFPQNTDKKKLEDTALILGKNLLQNPESQYAEHPYVRGFFNNYMVEIVPCYQIQSANEKQSAVDRTPLHTQYIQKHLQEQQKSEVRMLKQFLKGINCYGAEAQIQGFSGYLCELLIIKYGTFHWFINTAQHWLCPVILGVTKKPYPVFSTPLIFIDPVDTQRNVASAVSDETFKQCIQACQAYQQDPKLTFFYPNPLIPWSLTKIQEYLKQTQRQFYAISFTKPDILDENLFPQLRKSIQVISNLLKKNDFGVKNIWYYIDERQKQVYIIIEPENTSVTAEVTHVGPPHHQKKHVQEFVAKWQNNPKTIQPPYLKNNRYYVTIQREYTLLYELLHHELACLSLGKQITNQIQEGFKLHTQEELFHSHLQEMWTRILEQKKPWDW